MFWHDYIWLELDIFKRSSVTFAGWSKREHSWGLVSLKRGIGCILDGWKEIKTQGPKKSRWKCKLGIWEMRYSAFSMKNQIVLIIPKVRISLGTVLILIQHLFLILIIKSIPQSNGKIGDMVENNLKRYSGLGWSK